MTISQAAELFNVGRRWVKRGREVLELRDQTLVEAVEAGHVSGHIRTAGRLPLRASLPSALSGRDAHFFRDYTCPWLYLTRLSARGYCDGDCAVANRK